MYWRVPPPACRALEALLAAEEHDQATSAALPEQAPALDLSWGVLRDAPLEGKHGGPLCAGSRRVPLSGASRAALLALLRVRKRSFFPR